MVPIRWSCPQKSVFFRETFDRVTLVILPNDLILGVFSVQCSRHQKLNQQFNSWSNTAQRFNLANNRHTPRGPPLVHNSLRNLVWQRWNLSAAFASVAAFKIPGLTPGTLFTARESDLHKAKQRTTEKRMEKSKLFRSTFFFRKPVTIIDLPSETLKLPRP